MYIGLHGKYRVFLSDYNETFNEKDLKIFENYSHVICVEKKNQLDAIEWFIALIICSTCFGHRCARNMLSIL